jgi:hypothetical protein
MTGAANLSASPISFFPSSHALTRCIISRQKPRKGHAVMRLRTYHLALASAVILLCSQNFKPSPDEDSDFYTGPRATITGRVLAPGTLAVGLQVDLIEWPGFDSKLLASTGTDGSGQYRFSSVPRGKFWLGVHTPEGYVAPSEPFHRLPGFCVYSSEGKPVENPDLELIPGGAISGRLMNLDGDPVAGEMVTVDFAGEGRSQFLPDDRRTCTTDELGYYSLAGLPPGPYFVRAGTDVASVTGKAWSKYDFFIPGRLNRSTYFPETFHPAAANKAAGIPITVASGGEATDIDITVPPASRTFSASGRVVGAESGTPISNCIINLGTRTDHGYGWGSFFTEDQPRTAEDGTFRITGLLPGRFFAFASFEGNSELYGIPEEFEINDRNMEGLELKAVEGTSISGVVVIDGDQGRAAISRLARMKVSAAGASFKHGGNEFIRREVDVAPDGSFKLHGFAGGAVALSILEDDLPFNLHFSMSRVEHSAASRREIGVKEGEPVTGVRVLVKYNDAALRGDVSVRDGQLPADMELEAVVRSTENQSGSEGSAIYGTSFKLKRMAPGQYEVYILGDRKIISETQTVILTNGHDARLNFTLEPAAITRDQ